MLHGRKIFIYFAAFFGVIVCMNAVLITLATQSHTGLVTDHAYEKGLAYNNVVHAAAMQEASGITAQIDYHDGMLSVVLKDSGGAILTPSAMQALFTRPTQDGMDFSSTLTNSMAKLHFPAAGLWHVRVLAEVEGQKLQFSTRILVDAHDTRG